LQVGFASHVRRVNPRLWFFFKFLRYKHLRGEPEIRALPSFVPRGRMAIDVGSSLGLYSRALAPLVPKVMAFEANPTIARFASALAPQNVEVVNIALSAAAGRATLRIPLNARGFTTDDLATIEQKQELSGAKYVTIDVPTKPLDDYEFPDCGFIKIDVEGHEEAVLDGATHLVERHRPTLMIELDESFNPGTIARVTARLSRLAYEGYFLSGRRMRPIAEFRVERHQNRAAVLALPPHRRRNAEFIVNFIFVPNEAAARTHGIFQ
jgi:FkbM family methyltransferase